MLTLKNKAEDFLAYNFNYVLFDNVETLIKDWGDKILRPDDDIIYNHLKNSEYQQDWVKAGHIYFTPDFKDGLNEEEAQEQLEAYYDEEHYSAWSVVYEIRDPEKGNILEKHEIVNKLYKLGIGVIKDNAWYNTIIFLKYKPLHKTDNAATLFWIPLFKDVLGWIKEDKEKEGEQ